MTEPTPINPESDPLKALRITEAERLRINLSEERYQRLMTEQRYLQTLLQQNNAAVAASIKAREEEGRALGQKYGLKPGMDQVDLESGNIVRARMEEAAETPLPPPPAVANS